MWAVEDDLLGSVCLERLCWGSEAVSGRGHTYRRGARCVEGESLGVFGV